MSLDGVIGRDVRLCAAGAGRMGRSIAVAFACAGREIAVVDLKPRAAAAFARLEADLHAEVDATLGTLVELGALTPALAPVIAGRIRVVPDGAADPELAQADIVFEGVPETLEAKREAFGRLSRAARSDAILASTTSTILVTDLIAFATHPERVVNAHWLNPAYLIPLVELSVHRGTDPAVTARLRALLTDIGKKPVVCGATPGFIVPRLQALLMNEAARLVEEGAASAEDIDTATRYGLGLRFAAVGVVEFIDFGGVDILHHASQYLGRTVSAERYAVPGIVDRMMQSGQLGLRSGQGFFDHRDRDAAAYRRDVLARMLQQLHHAGVEWRPR